MTNYFKIIAQTGQSRAGILLTSHGEIKTPAFFPCATHASLRGLDPVQLDSTKTSQLLVNAYHLYLRPGIDLIEDLGGLHQFMGWNKPILTDSGGFQAFALPRFAKRTDDGITFRSHLDGSEHFFTPELVIKIQERLGVDLATCLDVCTGFPESEGKVMEAVEQTNRWAMRSIASWSNRQMLLYGMVQGSIYKLARAKSVEFLRQLPFSGFAIGGNMYTFGQTVAELAQEKPKMWEIVSYTTGLLPEEKPRHLLGVGEPEDLIRGVASGIDTFDCVMATRIARHGSAWVKKDRWQFKRVNLVSSQESRARRSLDPNCHCRTCQRQVSRAYLRHLLKERDPAAGAMISIHNLFTLEALMTDIREAIMAGTFMSREEAT